jgi:3-oxoadipate enol-lactonase
MPRFGACVDLPTAEPGTLVLVGALDLQAVHDEARRLAVGIAGVRRVDWPGTAHLPSMERPEDFLALLRDWLPRRSPDPS